jgi:hypothetical protein
MGEKEEGSWAVGLVLCPCGVRVGLMQGILGAIVLVAVSERGLVRLTRRMRSERSWGLEVSDALLNSSRAAGPPPLLVDGVSGRSVNPTAFTSQYLLSALTCSRWL